MTFPSKFLNGLRGLVAAFALMLVMRPVPAPAADDLKSVLAGLDASAAKFKSAQADINWDVVQTEPLPEDDKQTGTVLFERRGAELAMALHFKTYNGKPVLKDLTFAGGTGKLYEPQLNQITVFRVGNNQAEADTILTLGFGGSGKDLEKSWTVTYAGTEQIEGKAAAKLELVPRDEGVRNTFPKVLLWVDAGNGIAVKQQFFDASGNYRLVTYHNVRLNAPVPSGAFEIKAPGNVKVVNH